MGGTVNPLNREKRRLALLPVLGREGRAARSEEAGKWPEGTDITHVHGTGSECARTVAYSCLGLVGSLGGKFLEGTIGELSGVWMGPRYRLDSRPPCLNDSFPLWFPKHWVQIAHRPGVQQQAGRLADAKA